MMDELTTALSSDLDGAFPGLVESMGQRLYWGLRRICGDHHEAEDLTQETFIRAYRAMGEFDRDRFGELALEAWVWTIALNLGRNHLRSRSRRPTFVGLEDRGGHDPEPFDDDAWDKRLSVINGHRRKAVVLRHLVGLDIATISRVTGRPEGTVKADIHRGLKRLRLEMEQES